MSIAQGELADRLRHVYWIGGGSGAGKSTVSKRIAAERGMRLYATDDVMMDHQRRSNPQACPAIAAFLAMSMDERWLTRSPEIMLQTFHWFRGEAFNLIVEDLLALPPDKLILAEGFRLLPELVRPLLQRRSQAVWLIPTPEFRLSAFTSRGSLMDIAGKTSDPAKALDNLLRRDAMFTCRVEQEAIAAGLQVVQVDGQVDVSEATRRTTDLLNLPLDLRARQ